MKKIITAIMIAALILPCFSAFADYDNDYANPYITDYFLDINYIGVLASAHGTVSPSGANIRIIGSSIDLIAVPDAGYSIEYIKVNQNAAAYTLNGNVYTVTGLSNGDEITVGFSGAYTVTAYENKYKGYYDLSDKIYDIVFASFSGDTSKITEVGFEIDGRKYKSADRYLSKVKRTKTYGIGFCDADGIYADRFVTRPYLITSDGEEIYGNYLTVNKSDPESYEYAEWSDRNNINTYQGTEWRFLPPADYISEQNPPDFSWPYVPQAVMYDLIISKDKDFSSVYASAYGLNVNYYNFAFAFDEDIYYYKVRFHTSDKVSRWSKARKFTIKSGAVQFAVDDIDTILSKIPAEHPRIAVNPDTETAFKALKSGAGASYYNSRRETVNELIRTGEIQQEPETNSDFETAAYKIGGQCTTAAWIYYMDNDAAAGEYAKTALLQLAGWDPQGTSSYVSNDLRFRDLIYYMGFTYTYIRDLLSSAERETVLSAIKTRAEILIHPAEGVMDAIFQLESSPYMSHGGSAVRHLLQTALCVYGDLPEAEDWLRDYLLMYINFFPNWGYQDGGWSQGTGYGNGTLVDGEDLRYTLYINGMVNMYNKPFFKNAYNNLIYNLGADGYTGAEFGDQSTGQADPSWALSASNNAHTNANRYSQWFLNNCGFGRTGAYSIYYMNMLSAPRPLSPTNLPKSHYFKDIGWVSSLSEMNITTRLAAYFKSSSYGSHNHSHADQNSFTISRNGRQLAIDSGYYDGYGSNHYSNYYNATYAHNAITHDGGKGQSTYAMIANGDIVGYLSSDNFDLSSGDALNAYNYVYDPTTQGYRNAGTFEKVKRHFIYLRPDTFIVIDDVKYSGAAEGNIEWWLNGWNFTSVTDNSATIDNGTDSLDLKMQYPSNLSVREFTGFVNPSGTAVPASGKYADMPQSDRICYTAPSANAVRIVATMSVRSSSETPAVISSQSGNGYLKLGFEDGTNAYINLSDGMFSADGIRTDAVALIVKNGAYMIADGTELAVNNEPVISSDKVISAYVENAGFAISAAEDSNVTVYGVFSETYKDEYNNYRTNRPNDGVTWSLTSDGVCVSLMKGSFRFKY